MLYSFAFILDPRAKIKGFTSVLRLLSRFNDVDYSSYLTEVRTELSETYKKYETKFGSMRVRGLLNQSQLVRRSIHGVRYLLMMMVGLVT